MIKVQTQIDIEQYLAFERASDTKHEYLFNTIIARKASSFEHNVISGNLAALIWFHLRKSEAKVFQNDMRTYNPINQRFMYPDVVVSDGKPMFRQDEKMDNLTNPVLVVEILSESTAVFDKTDKFIAYKSIPSLKEYVLILTDSPEIEIYRKSTADHWLLIKTHQLESKITFIHN
jgi:Uma2 family endonuclease